MHQNMLNDLAEAVKALDAKKIKYLHARTAALLVFGPSSA